MTEFWLVYYKQRLLGQDVWTEANDVTDMSPTEFVIDMQTNFPTYESILCWATPISRPQYDRYQER